MFFFRLGLWNGAKESYDCTRAIQQTLNRYITETNQKQAMEKLWLQEDYFVNNIMHLLNSSQVKKKLMQLSTFLFYTVIQVQHQRPKIFFFIYTLLYDHEFICLITRKCTNNFSFFFWDPNWHFFCLCIFRPNHMNFYLMPQIKKTDKPLFLKEIFVRKC